jgi:phosphoribosylamine---glycine ligase
MRLKSDLFEVLLRATDGTLDRAELEWDRRTALGVVMAAANYPGAPRTDDVITGVQELSKPGPSLLAAAAAAGGAWGEDELQVFHAATALFDGQLVTTGGRVLCVTALADSPRIAQNKALAAVRAIAFDGAQWRNDIGHRAIKR